MSLAMTGAYCSAVSVVWSMTANVRPETAAATDERAGLGQRQTDGVNCGRWGLNSGAAQGRRLEDEANVSGTPFSGFPTEAWALFAAMTIGPQFLGHTVFNHLLGELRASVVSVALLAEPVAATLLAFLIFHERPGPQVVVGAVIVLAGVAITVLAEAARRPEVLAAPEG